MREKNLKILITCEHGGNHVPAAYKHVFAGAQSDLESHRGYDIGALELFHLFVEQAADFSRYSQTSRLLVELNRSLHHTKLFSEFTNKLPKAEKDLILQEQYFPYRNQVEGQVAEWVKEGGKVLHLSVHSFTPETAGKVRTTDIGILYDPSREWEQLFAAHWRQKMHQVAPLFKIRYNYPYKGTADGFVTYLRKQFGNAHYAGLELEVNQRFPLEKQREWEELKLALVQSFLAAL